MQTDGLRDILHRHRRERLPGKKIRHLPLQNFLTAAQQCLLPLTDAVDEPFRLRDLFCEVLPDLRILAFMSERAIEAADRQLRRVGLIDADAEHAAFFMDEHIRDNVAVVRRAAELRAGVGRKTLNLPISLLNGREGDLLTCGNGGKGVMSCLLQIPLGDPAGQIGFPERPQLKAQTFGKCSCTDAGRVEPLYDLNGSVKNRRRAKRRKIGAQIAVGVERVDHGKNGALHGRLQRKPFCLEEQVGRQVLPIGDGILVGKIGLRKAFHIFAAPASAGGKIVEQTYRGGCAAFKRWILQQSSTDIGLQLAHVQL